MSEEVVGVQSDHLGCLVWCEPQYNNIIYLDSHCSSSLQEFVKHMESPAACLFVRINSYPKIFVASKHDLLLLFLSGVNTNEE